ncbi:TetR/AcrR family transcriptional regulator [Noviherbaspirillum sedimenti]|uniref:TetR/AcrR family transcriptional regulator n=1 Tax=Noviherbaspirillum sedimenti TaxID=2320865 RepID=UPI001F15DBCA|nr:TetR/AcrR family transcriptional regulator [Noviherbaspirillum sedimenti]
MKIAAKLFAERGYHAVGMTELGEAVELGRGTLYHHIKSKEDVLYDISRHYISSLVEHGNHILKTEADPKLRLQLLGKHLMTTIADHQAELTVCFREIYSLTGERRNEVLMLHGEYEHIWRQVLIDGEKKGIFRPYNPIRLKGLLGMFFYTYLWMKPDGAQGPEAIADIFNEIVLASVAGV